MVSWGARLLYAGPAVDLSWHANAVGEFSIALNGGLEVRTAGGDVIRAQSVFVPAGARHLMTFRSPRVACLYVDVASNDGARLVRQMTDLGAGFAAGHASEARLTAVIDDLMQDRIAAGSRKQRISEAFGLDPLTTIDPVVISALQHLHDAPDKTHRVAALATRFGLSESQFRKAFRGATGVPLRRYRVWVRLAAAMKAAQSGATLTEAAYAAGFSSSAHLSIAYRGMFGMTPSSFLAVLSQAAPSVRS